MILLFLAALILLALFVTWNRKAAQKIEAVDFAMIVGLLFHMSLVLLLMTKAALKLRYSLSLASIMPVFIFVLIKLLQTTPWKISIPLTLFYIASLMGVVISLFPQMQLAARRAEQEQEAQVAKVQAINRLAQEKKVKEEDIVVVYAYAVPLKCAGLLEATNWTGNFQKEMRQICPNQYAIWDSEIELNTAVPVRSLDDIAWDVVVWPGNGTNLPDTLYAKGAINIPASWHVKRDRWFFIRPLQK
jgi:hypothetical protein